MTPHPDDWLKAYLEELPILEDRTRAAERLAEQVAGWSASDEARLRQAATARHVVTGTEAVEMYLEEMRLDRPPAIYTGWHDLDEHLGRPITAGELVLIAARPGVGKTWALQAWIEKTLALDPSAAAALLEMEMLAWHVGERLGAHAMGLSPRDLGLRARSEHERLTIEEVSKAQPLLERLSIHPRSLTVGQLAEALDAATERLGVRPTILAVDYMGLLAWDGSPGASTYQRASDNARQLKDIAREENVVILAASQLSRAAGTGSSKPGLDALRDSGVLEEAADRILGMWRDAPIQDENAPDETEGDILVTVLKNRHGRSSGRDFPLRFDEAMRLVESGTEAQEEFPF